MAGDWIKWEKGLVNKPEVAQIARALGINRCEAAARLMLVWEWADSSTADGNMDGIAAEDIDRVAGMDGVAIAMASVRPSAWLMLDDEGAIFPNYERHNGKNGKRRAMEKNRQESHRNRTGKESGYRPWRGGHASVTLAP